MYLLIHTNRPPGECYAGYHAAGYTDGSWAFVNPPPAGEHVIKNKGEAHIPEGKWLFRVDTTYHLTVGD